MQISKKVVIWAINNVPYIDANGQEQHRDGVTGVINSTDTLNAGWYVVMPTGNEKQTGTLVCQGEVHLIVYDGAKLTATGADNKPGIEVSGEGNSLTIYGYTNQSGQLIANGGANAAAIGSGDGGDAASNIFVATSFVVKAGSAANPTTVIENDGTDLASKLEGKQYATVEKGVTPTALPQMRAAVKATKVMTNGQVILRQGKKNYTILGQEK